LGEIRTLGAVLDRHPLAPQILVGLDVLVVFEDCHLDARLEVGLRKVEDLLAFIGDGHAGDDAVDLVGLYGLQGGVETQRFDVDGEALVLGDGPDQVHVDSDEIALGVLEFERCERGVRGDHVVRFLRRRCRGRQQRQADQAGENARKERREPISGCPSALGVG
jgi:hypothetical protein